VILKDPTKSWDQIEIDPVKLTTAIQKYKIGSILNVAESGAFDIKQWQNIITTSDWTPGTVPCTFSTFFRKFHLLSTF
jgi:hypothetical protein